MEQPEVPGNPAYQRFFQELELGTGNFVFFELKPESFLSMNSPPSITRYNHRILQMAARTSSGLRLGWLTFVLAFCFFPSSLSASNMADAARQLAHNIAANAGPGLFAFALTNHSSLEEKSVREVRSALEAELHLEGVQTANSDQSIGSVTVVLSESLREYVWTAEVAIGSDEKKIAIVSLPRAPTAITLAQAPQVALKATLLFAQERPILDAATVEMPGGSRLLVLDSSTVTIYHRQGPASAGRWELEESLPVAQSHIFPRDLRGRLLLRRDHLFDIYLPGVLCRSVSNAGSALTIACNGSDDPWPLSSEDAGLRAFFASARNFFTGALSPAIGKVANVPSFYSAAAIPRANYTLWAFMAVDGSLHLVDGMTDQLIRDGKWGSDLAAVHSGCGTGTQLLLSADGTPDRDSVAAFEIPDRDPISTGSAVDFDGRLTALWPESGGTSAMAVVKRRDAELYEAYRVSISCSN